MLVTMETVIPTYSSIKRTEVVAPRIKKLFIIIIIIPRAQMVSESIAHEAEGRMGY